MLERTLSPYIKEKTAEIISNLRARPQEDPQAQRLYEHWYETASLVSPEIKDKIGFLWMTEILGVEKETANKFVEGDSDAWTEIGHLHAGGDRKWDAKGFWEGVDKLVPGFISKKDIKYLIKVDESEYGALGAWRMISIFNIIRMYDITRASPVIRMLCSNAHVCAK